MLFAVKTVVGRENVVLEAIASRARGDTLRIQSLVHPDEIKGYIFVEGELEDIEKALQAVPHVRGLIKNAIDMKQVERFLQPTTVEVSLDVGDIVEVVGGPFKGEKGKVTRHEKEKREVTIELLEVSVPIPVTVSVEFVKVLEKAAGKG